MRVEPRQLCGAMDWTYATTTPKLEACDLPKPCPFHREGFVAPTQQELHAYRQGQLDAYRKIEALKTR